MKRVDLTDEELLDRFREDPQKCRNCLEELFRRYQRPVAAWCYRMTGQRESALDLTQEVFLKAYRGLNGFRGRSRFSTWLYSITRNHCLNAIRKQSGGPREVDLETVEKEPSEAGADWIDRLNAKIDSREMLRFLNDHLSDIESQVMILHYGQGYRLATITGLMGLKNASGAKAYIVSAKRKIDRALKRLTASRA